MACVICCLRCDKERRSPLLFVCMGALCGVARLSEHEGASGRGGSEKVRALGGVRLALMVISAVLLAYGVTAYIVMPQYWTHYAHKHPRLDDVPDITHTKSGMPGDPLNVALIGSKAEVMTAMIAAKWYPADPLTLRSCLEIAEASVLKRPYAEAPVSNLYLWDRREDLAFEQPVGDDPRQRHHVRFWRASKTDPDGRPVWVGSAVYDQHVGLSRTTGQITHVTASDVDAERDYLFRDLEKTGDLAETYEIDDFHTTRSGKNGGGDPWTTDGAMRVGIIGLPTSAAK